MALAALLGSTACCAGAQAAAPGVIDGNPLVIELDATGLLSSHFAGSPNPSFDHPVELPLWTFTDASASLDPRVGVTPPSIVSGTGTQLDPYEVSVVFDSGSLRVTETVDYVEGATDFALRYQIENRGAGAQRFRVVPWAILHHGTVSLGQGAYFAGDASAPRQVYGYNDAQGEAAGIFQIDSSPWDHFVEESSDVGIYFQIVDPAGLPDTIDPSLARDLVAVEWDDYYPVGLAPGATATWDVGWFLDRYNGLALADASNGASQGSTATVTATSLNNGEPVVGKPVRWSVTGANPGSGASLTDGGGSAAISWTAAHPGVDTLTAYIDANDNGTYDPASETEQQGTITWTATAAQAQLAQPAAMPPPPPQRAAVTGLTVKPRALVAASSRASIAARRGATVSYDDTAAALTTFRVLRLSDGVRRGARCVKPGRHARGRRCTRTSSVHGSFTHRDAAGRNRFHFTGAVGGRPLRPGRYRLVARPAGGDAAGTGFRVLPR